MAGLSEASSISKPLSAALFGGGTKIIFLISGSGFLLLTGLYHFTNPLREGDIGAGEKLGKAAAGRKKGELRQCCKPSSRND